MNRDSVYETTDFYLSCFLKAKGFKILDIKREGRRTTFIFEDRPDRKGLIRGFYNNEGSVNPLDYQDAIKNLKALTYNY